jgi:hypothetical protein
MSKYEIQAPDGKTYRIEGPAGASEEQIQAEVLKQHPNAAFPPQDARNEEYSHRGADLPGATSYAPSHLDPTVDYSGVDDAGKQAVYSLLSTPAEKAAYLRKEYGPENVTKSSYGQDVVLQNGKKVAFERKGDFFSTKNLASRAASVAGEILPTVGMIAGGVAGAPSTLGAVGTAAAGAAAGTAGNKLIKDALGLNQQTAGETAQDIAVSGAEGAGGELAGAATRFAGRSVLAPWEPGSILGPWKETLPRYLEQKAEYEKVKSELPGFTPNVGVVQPRASLAQANQKVAQDIFGDSKALANKAVLESKKQELIRRVGGEGKTPENLNLSISGKAGETIVAAEEKAKVAEKTASAILKTAEDKISAKLGPNTGNAKELLSDGIRASKEVWAEAHSAMYAAFDKIALRPVIPTVALKTVATEALRKRAVTEGGKEVVSPMPMLGRILEMPDRITAEQMQMLRHELGSMSEAEALNAGVSAGIAKRLGGAANDSFDTAVSDLKKRVGEYGAKNVTAGINALRVADASYHKGIKKYQDLTVQSLIKDSTQGGAIQPEKITEYLVRPDQVARLVNVKNLVSPEIFKQVASQHWERLLSQASDPMTEEVSGARLFKMLDGKENDVLFGAQANEMRNLAKQLAAVGGHLDPALLPVKGYSTVNAGIRDAIKKKVGLNNLVRGSIVSAVKDGGEKSLVAADYITQPDGLLRFRQINAAFGANSPEVKGLKEYLARKILAAMEVPASQAARRYTGKELSGAPLVAELERYGEPYLREVMGKAWTEDAFKFARVADTATRPLANVAGAGIVVSGGIKTSPFHHKVAALKYLALGEIYSKPAVLKYLSGGFEHGKVIDIIRRLGDVGSRAAMAYGAQSSPSGYADETKNFYDPEQARARRRQERNKP